MSSYVTRASNPQYQVWHTGQSGQYTFVRWARVLVETDPPGAAIFEGPLYQGDAPLEYRLSRLNANLAQLVLEARIVGSVEKQFALVPPAYYGSPEEAENNPQVVKIVLG